MTLKTLADARELLSRIPAERGRLFGCTSKSCCRFAQLVTIQRLSALHFNP
jgi:hypothetical protein